MRKTNALLITLLTALMLPLCIANAADSDAANPDAACSATPPVRIISANQASEIPASPCVVRVRSKFADQTFPAYRTSSSSSIPASTPTRRMTRKSKRRLPEEDVDIRSCVAGAAATYRISETVLYLLLDVEGGTLGETSANTNGSWDIGPMQVNSSWLPRFRRMGVTEEDLMHDLCTNIMAGAWIYSSERQRSKSTAEAIARYHSQTPVHQQRYLGSIEKAIDRRLGADALAAATASAPR